MDLISFFKWLDADILGIPATILFFGAGIFFTLKTGFIQIRALPRFLSLLTGGVKKVKTDNSGVETQNINAFHALFAAMATTIGTGSIVGPSTAVITGGPSALFWLMIYIFFGSVTKFVEVTFSLHTRRKTSDGHIIGGPMEYLKSVHPYLGRWYGAVTLLLFVSFSSVQSNTLASIFYQVNIPKWFIGLFLSCFVAFSLQGGAKRIGLWASRLVPLMFVLYVSFGLFIVLKDIAALKQAIKMVFGNVFTFQAAFGAFTGATIMQAMRAGLYRAVMITEAGLGTSAIPHAVADTRNPTDQGVLAMGSTIAELALSVLSGLMVLVTGVWATGEFRSTLIYEVFKHHTPEFGRIVLLASIFLFSVTTIVGNTFNGSQNFAALTDNRWVKFYVGISILLIFGGVFVSVPLVWAIMDTILLFVAVPNLLGLLWLSVKNPDVIRMKE